MDTNKIEIAIQKGKKYIKPNREQSWKHLCYSICRRNGLGEVGIEIINEAIETMRLFEEENLSTQEAIERVGGGWCEGISSCILQMIIIGFSKKESFSDDWEELKRESNKRLDIDDLPFKNR